MIRNGDVDRLYRSYLTCLSAEFVREEIYFRLTVCDNPTPVDQIEFNRRFEHMTKYDFLRVSDLTSKAKQRVVQELSAAYASRSYWAEFAHNLRISDRIARTWTLTDMSATIHRERRSSASRSRKPAVTRFEYSYEVLNSFKPSRRGRLSHTISISIFNYENIIKQSQRHPNENTISYKISKWWVDMMSLSKVVSDSPGCAYDNYRNTSARYVMWNPTNVKSEWLRPSM
jgi:hypothetical protein